MTFLPGVNTAGINRDSNFNGLPDSFVAITLDGVNNNDNFNKSTEGFFAMVTPRQDAIEAVTVTTAVGGRGRRRARRGVDQLRHALGHQPIRRQRLRVPSRPAAEHRTTSSTSSTGLPKNDVKLNQYGFRQGGPIVIPGLYNGRGKAFFFFNYEELRLPNNFTRTRIVLNPDAQRGIFRWDGSQWAGARTRRHWPWPRAPASSRTPDPSTAGCSNEIRASMATTGIIQPTTDRNTQNYVWQSPGHQIEKQPIVRLDYNLTDSHRLSGVYNWQVVTRDPDHLNGDDIRFPGAAELRTVHLVSSVHVGDACGRR